MRGLFTVLVVLLIIVACVGFYRGWFRVDSDTSSGQTHIQLTVDQNKIKADENKAENKVRQEIREHTK